MIINEDLTNDDLQADLPPLPSPLPSEALNSAKLAALHARLDLSAKIPLQTLARCLIDPSADADPRFNNGNLAFVGSTLIQSHASEWLIAHYPRLPMVIIFAAMKGMVGVPALHQIGRAWGVEAAAAPGEEVDPGLLQFSTTKPTVQHTQLGYVRAETKSIEKFGYRRGMSSRVVYDDAFGDEVQKETPGSEEGQAPQNSLFVSSHKNSKEQWTLTPSKNAHANFVRATIGAIYLHCGQDAAKHFIKAYVLSRRIDLASMFGFKMPERELARLCAREDFEPPVARLISETGRLSRTPVFIVGVYSGADKLGEGSGPSLDSARTAAAMNALKSWYLYSPGNDTPVPSDTFAEDAAPWKPLYVDYGEIIV